MSTVWFQNPENYLKQVIEAGTVRIFWDRSYLNKKRIDPHGVAKLVLLGTRYEYMILEKYGMTRWREGMGQIATYPTWNYHNENINLLEELCSNPLGMDMKVIQDTSIPFPQRPRMGQEHIICITDVPYASNNIAKKFYLTLTEFQEEYNVRFFLSRIFSFRIAFGLGFYGASMNAEESALQGRIILPSGRIVDKDTYHKYPMWTRIFGQTPHELSKTPRARIAYNIASMLYSQENFLKLTNPAQKAPARDITSPDSEAGLPQTKIKSPLSSLARTIKAGDRDKVNCDTCTLAVTCKYAREGSVCGVPGSDGISLSTYFNTRDADKIVTGLGALNGMLAKRLERKLNEEEIIGEDDPEITRIAGLLFKQGTELAKLLDPSLRGGAKVQVNVQGNGATQINSANFAPNQLMAEISRSLEARGIPRDKQTPAMIENFFKAMSNDSETQAREIESMANSVDEEDDEMLDVEVVTDTPTDISTGTQPESEYF